MTVSGGLTKVCFAEKLGPNEVAADETRKAAAFKEFDKAGQEDRLPKRAAMNSLEATELHAMGLPWSPLNPMVPSRDAALKCG